MHGQTVLMHVIKNMTALISVPSVVALVMNFGLDIALIAVPSFMNYVQTVILNLEEDVLFLP